MALNLFAKKKPEILNSPESDLVPPEPQKEKQEDKKQEKETVRLYAKYDEAQVIMLELLSSIENLNKQMLKNNNDILEALHELLKEAKS